MTDMQITFNSEGFRQILLGDGVKSVVSQATETIASRANANLLATDSAGYEAVVEVSSKFSSYSNGERWAGFVVSVDSEASIDQAENKSLSRAVTG